MTVFYKIGHYGTKVFAETMNGKSDFEFLADMDILHLPKRFESMSDQDWITEIKEKRQKHLLATYVADETATQILIENVNNASLLIADLDGVGKVEDFEKRLRANLSNFNFFAYETLSNGIKKPEEGLRCRVVVETNTEMTDIENEKALRKLAELLEVPHDEDNDHVNALKGAPINRHQQADDFWLIRNDGKALDVADFIAGYELPEHPSEDLPTMICTAKHDFSEYEANFNGWIANNEESNGWASLRTHVRYWLKQNMIDLGTAEHMMIASAYGNQKWEQEALESLKPKARKPARYGGCPCQYFGNGTCRYTRPQADGETLPAVTAGAGTYRWDDHLAGQINAGFVDKIDSKTLCDYVMDNDPLFADMFGYDEFNKKQIFLRDSDPYLGIYSDKVGKGKFVDLGNKSELVIAIGRFFTMNYKTVRKEHIVDAIIDQAGRNRFDSAIDWISKDEEGNPLKWDGVDHIGKCAVEILKARDTEMNKLILRAFICNLVNRASKGKHEPTFYKYALVLLGAQDAGKSTFLRKLAGSYFVDEVARVGLDNPRFNTLLKKALIVEMPETYLFKKADMELIKAVITQTQLKGNDFGNSEAEDFNLRNVYAITANSLDFIKDSTGSARFFPLEVAFESDPRETGKLIAKLTTKQIKQMFAQAWALLAEKGFEALTIPEDYQAELTEARESIQFTSDHFDLLKDYLNTPFPIDTFEPAMAISGQVFDYQRHWNDWALIDRHGDWNAEQYQQIYGREGNKTDCTIRPETETATIERVSIRDLMGVLGIDPAESQYSKKDLENDLQLLGFVKEKGRKITHFGFKRSDTWARASLKMGSGYPSKFIKPQQQ